MTNKVTVVVFSPVGCEECYDLSTASESHDVADSVWPQSLHLLHRALESEGYNSSAVALRAPCPVANTGDLWRLGTLTWTLVPPYK